MARFAVETGMALYIRDGDGLGNMTAVGGVVGLGQSGGPFADDVKRHQFSPS